MCEGVGMHMAHEGWGGGTHEGWGVLGTQAGGVYMAHEGSWGRVARKEWSEGWGVCYT